MQSSPTRLRMWMVWRIKSVHRCFSMRCKLQTILKTRNRVFTWQMLVQIYRFSNIWHFIFKVGPWRKSQGYISHSGNAKRDDFNSSFSCNDIENNETIKTEDDSDLSLAAGLFIAIAILVVIVVIVVLVYFISIIGENLEMFHSLLFIIKI